MNSKENELKKLYDKEIKLLQEDDRLEEVEEDNDEINLKEQINFAKYQETWEENALNNKFENAIRSILLGNP